MKTAPSGAGNADMNRKLQKGPKSPTPPSGKTLGLGGYLKIAVKNGWALFVAIVVGIVLICGLGTARFLIDASRWPVFVNSASHAIGPTHVHGPEIGTSGTDAMEKKPLDGA